MALSGTSRPLRASRAARSRGVKIELLVSTRKRRSRSTSRARKSAALIGDSPQLFGHVAVAGGQVVGTALWFLTFSTWRGTHGIHLEDLYVQPAHRGRGLGRELLRTLAQECVDRGFARLEWSVLDWNTPSIEFYRAAGAVPMEGWTVFRLTGDALADLAADRR